ncbi:AGAP006417-PA-like protein [Anopheles sinensis]|uniref:AGAP006417-PA-like protein n=1 Tax=Anopheles sinensis TaxID=74873 RepID=A0A084WJV1_ANOSI|nr:AGAP006417-PA-like protein [Anopheles sinensis]
MDTFMLSCFFLAGRYPDYCTNSYCVAGLKNVGCDPPPITGGVACSGKNSTVVELSQTDRIDFMDGLNNARHRIARGRFAPIFPTAKRMLKLHWSATLAAQAGHNARGCVFKKDECRNTPRFSDVGQSVVLLEIPDSDSYSTLDLWSILLLETDNEFSKYLSGAASSSSYSASAGVENVSNFVNDRSFKVGCAVQHWLEDGGAKMFYMVCNFSANLIEGEPLYTFGATATGCVSGTDIDYPALCSAKEVP